MPTPPSFREKIEELEKDPMIGKLIWPLINSVSLNVKSGDINGVLMFERWTATPKMVRDTYEHRMSTITQNRPDVEPTTDTRTDQ